MSINLAAHLAIKTTGATVTHYTRPVNVTGFNAIHVQATISAILTGAGGEIKIIIERGLDQINWNEYSATEVLKFSTAAAAMTV